MRHGPWEDEVKFEFARASGPGGQNVNKVSTAVRLRFDVAASKVLSDEVKSRLSQIASNRLTKRGILIVEARRFRTQEQNRQDALERMRDLITRAGRRPKRRTRTKPTADARERRLETKRRRGAAKRSRASLETE